MPYAWYSIDRCARPRSSAGRRGGEEGVVLIDLLQGRYSIQIRTRRPAQTTILLTIDRVSGPITAAHRQRSRAMRHGQMYDAKAWIADAAGLKKGILSLGYRR